MQLDPNVFGVDYAKLLLGEDVRRLHCRLFMLDRGEQDGQGMALVGGILTGDGLPLDRQYAQLWAGEILLKPMFIGIDDQNSFRGASLCGALTSGGLSYPEFTPILDRRPALAE